MPLFGDKCHEGLTDTLKHIATLIEKPSAIVIVSAHWEEEKPTVTSGARPSLIYDYFGFPKESYQIQYPAPGKPALAHRIADLLTKNNIDAVLDEDRGFDHGLFIPLKIMYPAATIPCVQLSLVKGLSPVQHIRMGKALAELRKENVLVIGSGSSFHNIKSFFSPASTHERSMNEAFEKWLHDTCYSHELNEEVRERMLVNWEAAPAASFCHPREEHLIPLHVCYGLAESPARQMFAFELMGKRSSCYLW